MLFGTGYRPYDWEAGKRGVILDGLAIRGNDCQNDQDNLRNKVSGWILGLKQ